MAAAILPYIPGSYVSKGAKLVGSADDLSDIARLFSKADNLSDAAKAFISKSDSIIMSYRELKKTVKMLGIKGMEAHHLIEKRFANRLGINANDLLSVLIDKETHQKITQLFRQKIGYALDLKNPLRTPFATPQEIWNVTVEVYRALGLEKYLSALKQQLLDSASKVGDITDWIID